MNKPFNEPAANYAIDAARHFDFLTHTLHWSWRGHVINLVTQAEALDPRASLSALERAVYAKYYLESDGAILLRFLATLLERRTIAWNDIVDTSLMEDLFREALKDYLKATTDIQDRAEIRQSLGQLDRAAKPKTRKHKATFHIEALLALGLIERCEVGRGHAYRLLDPAVASALTDHISARQLERAMSDEGGWRLVRALYPSSQSGKPNGTLTWLASAYRRIMATGLQVCPLAAVVDFVVAKGLSETPSMFNSPSEIMAELTASKDRHPDLIRFHIDRTGNPAYLLLSEEVLKAFDV